MSKGSLNTPFFSASLCCLLPSSLTGSPAVIQELGLPAHAVLASCTLCHPLLAVRHRHPHEGTVWVVDDLAPVHPKHFLSHPLAI